MLLLSKKEIFSIFSMEEAIAADKIAFKTFSSGNSTVPLRTQLSTNDKKGTFLFMPAYAPDLEVASLKTISIFPDNINRGLPSAPSQVLLIDGTNGLIQAILDGEAVTQLRTGAASGAALDVLGIQEARKGALIGTGSQARCQLEAMLTVRKDLEVVTVYDFHFERAQAFAKEMTILFEKYGTTIVPVATANEAIEEADLIITVTSSKTPVFDGALVKNGATISGVGSYQPDMQEIDPATFRKAAKIYCDSKKAVFEESGDMIKALEKGAITKENFKGELGQVLSKEIVGRENNDEIILFKTVGIGTQDLVTASKIYDKAKQLAVGTSWN